MTEKQRTALRCVALLISFLCGCIAVAVSEVIR